MKKNLLSLLFFLSVSFLLSGLQGSLYFFPISIPYFWFIIFTYYSFRKNLLFSLVANLFHAFVICCFTSISVSMLLITMNLLTLGFVAIRERFHTSQLHIAIASGLGCFFFLLSKWSIQCLYSSFFYPQLLSWVSVSFVTFLVSPLLIRFLASFDEKIHYERVDTLVNLRI